MLVNSARFQSKMGRSIYIIFSENIKFDFFNDFDFNYSLVIKYFVKMY